MRPRVVAIASVALLAILAIALTSCDDLTDPTTTSSSTTTEESSTTTVEEPTATTKPSTATTSATTVSMVAVPNVGFPNTPAEATDALAAVGLVASRAYTSSTGSMDYGRVVWQDPAPGTMVPVGSTVVITIHGTGEKAEVPDLIGMTQGDAEMACFAEYLHCHTNYVSGKPLGIVFDQAPAAGTLLAEGDSVTIYVGQ